MYAELYCNDIEIKIKNLMITKLDYRGEIGVILVNLSNEEYTVQPKERIAQLVVNSIARAYLYEVNFLKETDRGEGGFGHTGK